MTDKIDSQLTYKGNIVVKAVDKDYKTVIDELEKDTDYSVEEPAEGNENTLIISLRKKKRNFRKNFLFPISRQSCGKTEKCTTLRLIFKNLTNQMNT